jgi:hypothetical protein
MKYIIFDKQYPLIFPDSILHYDCWLNHGVPTSAGHLRIKRGKVELYGESESLGIGIDKDDIKLIINLLEKER